MITFLFWSIQSLLFNGRVQQERKQRRKCTLDSMTRFDGCGGQNMDQDDEVYTLEIPPSSTMISSSPDKTLDTTITTIGDADSTADTNPSSGTVTQRSRAKIDNDNHSKMINKKKKKTKKKVKGGCYLCQSLEHRAKDCPTTYIATMASTTTTSSSPSTTFVCPYCKQRDPSDHRSVYQCPQKLKEEEQRYVDKVLYGSVSTAVASNRYGGRRRGW